MVVRLTEDPNLAKKVAVTLPRIGFEISGIEYDASRKQNKVIKAKKVLDGADNDQLKSGFMPVPYNVNFELFVMSKSSDDALQIVEQILPYFQPEYTVTMREVPELEIIRDVPIVLNSISYEDDYEGDFASRRSVIYTLSFTAKYYLYAPVTSTNVIRTVQVDQYAKHLSMHQQENRDIRLHQIHQLLLHKSLIQMTITLVSTRQQVSLKMPKIITL